MSDETTKNILERLDALERAVFKGQAQEKIAKTLAGKGETGATGGIRFLLRDGFFKEKRDLGQTRKGLGEHGYFYSRQAVHAALSGLSKVRGPLVALKEGRGKVYVERK